MFIKYKEHIINLDKAELISLNGNSIRVEGSSIFIMKFESANEAQDRFEQICDLNPITLKCLTARRSK